MAQKRKPAGAGKSGGSQPDRKVVAVNRKARHLYEILEEFETGLVLRGTEVKSLRGGKASLQEAYVRLEDGEAFLVGANIPPYTHAGPENHEPTRRRKLLLSHRELQKLKKGLKERASPSCPCTSTFRGRGSSWRSPWPGGRSSTTSASP